MKTRCTRNIVFVLIFLRGFLYSQDATSTSNSKPNLSHCKPFDKSPTKPNTPLVHLLHQVPPDYPKGAFPANVEGIVVLDIKIVKDGTVKDVNVRSGDPILASAAVNAVKQWRYAPLPETMTEVSNEITVKFLGNQLEISQRVNDHVDTSAQPSSQPGAVYEGGRDKPPRPVYMPDPGYTMSARKAKVQGTVSLALLITVKGEVGDVEVCKGLEPSLDQNAVDTVRTWKFQPATKDGEPVEKYVNASVNFKLYR